MPTLRSSVLIINHPNPKQISFGADFSTDFETAIKAVEEFSFPVVVLPSSKESSIQTLEFLEHVNQVSPLSQRVLIQSDTPADLLRGMINSGSIFRVLSTFDDAKFDHTIQEALDEYRLLQQNTKLLQLVNEQNERLRRLTADLEVRVEARRKSLDNAKEKLLTTNHRVEALHRALVAIHRARSIAEMERLINEALREALGLTWTRILFQSQGQLQYQGQQSQSAASLAGTSASDELSVSSAIAAGRAGRETARPNLRSGPRDELVNPLHTNAAAFSRSLVSLQSAALTRGKELLGNIYFARGANEPFSRDENSFLVQIADSVSLAIDRLTKLEQAETLKRQWEDTFDAILEPVSLIDTEFNVVRINRSFAYSAGTEPDKIIGRKCYEALFGRAAPCDGCLIRDVIRVKGAKLTPNFRLKSARTQNGQTVIYDVFSQEIPIVPEGRSLFVNMYRDISGKLLFERQILESAKMAELGTIGSSIAHELNNPLGGMLSFLQLIKMDLKGDEPWYSDIAEMEEGAKRCRDIVQSLLGFTRKSSHESSELIDLREVVGQALKITELQIRAMGIRVQQNLPTEPSEIHGSFNFLAQAIRNFLQNAQESITKRLKTGDRTPGVLSVDMSSDESHFHILISDNGYIRQDASEATEAQALGLSVAQQIITDLGGKVELISSKGSSVSAKISLPRPVFD